MTALAPTLEAFFVTRLVNEKGVSPHTIAAYRDTFRMLLAFAQKRTGEQPCKLEIEDLDAPLITSFLAPVGDPFDVPLRRVAPSRARRADRACDRSPHQTL